MFNYRNKNGRRVRSKSIKRWTKLPKGAVNKLKSDDSNHVNKSGKVTMREKTSLRLKDDKLYRSVSETGDCDKSRRPWTAADGDRLLRNKVTWRWCKVISDDIKLLSERLESMTVRVNLNLSWWIPLKSVGDKVSGDTISKMSNLRF